ncbi:hypothetical protein BsWGS_12245 [Bradybaena similaris]
MNEFEHVRLWLRNTYNIGVCDEWLMACLEWIQQEHEGVLPSVNDLLPQVFQQWLLSDLSEIGEQVLPQNIVSDEKSQLVGNYPLQLLSLIDVGSPLYGQKQKLQGRVNPNEEVSADKPFQPAVLIYGRVLCRRGIIMLTPECVQVLGGEVDTLVEQNTPLAVLEREMMRNRDDEGKHAKTEFSGTFLSCGADKMMDSSQKHFKKESFSGLTACEGISRHSLQPVKPELRGFASSSLGQPKLKQEIGQADPRMRYLEQEFKQEDDVNYDDCFSDELDLQEIDALDCSSAAGMEVDPIETKPSSTGFRRPESAHSLPGSRERGHPPCKLQNVAGTRTTLDLRLSTSLNQSVPVNLISNLDHPRNSPKPQNDFEVFDDDFEIDEISDNVHASSKNSAFGLPSVIGKNTFNSSAESKFMHNPSNENDSLHQIVQPMNKAVQQKPLLSSHSVPSKGLQNDLVRNTLFKVKSSSQERVENLDTSTKFSAKRQVKLSDMFSSNSDKKAKLTSANDDCAIIGGNEVTQPQDVFDDDCCIIDDKHLAQVSSRKSGVTSSNSSSTFLKTPSVGTFKSVSSRSAAASDSAPLRELPCPKQEKESGTETVSSTLSREVICPSPSTGGSLDVTDRPPFQYLCDLKILPPPVSLTVKAYISTLTDKLGTNGGANWSLACRINDGTACLDVDLADNVLAELIGFSAKDSVIMRQKMKSEPRVKDVLMEGLANCQQKLINMSCLMEVDIVATARKPVVKRLIPLSRQHVLELLKRARNHLSWGRI